MGLLNLLGKPVKEIVAMGYPESVAKRISSGDLPMDEASRAARRDAFGQPMFHASRQDIPEMKAGYSDGLLFVTPNQEFANNWLGKGKYQTRIGAEDEIRALRKEQKGLFFKDEVLNAAPEDRRSEVYDQMWTDYKDYIRNKDVEADKTYSSIYPMRAKSEKVFDPTKDFELARPFFEKQLGSPLSAESERSLRNGAYLYYENKDFVDWAKANGFDSIKLAENNDGVLDTLALTDPSQLRSEFAAFDPEYTGSNILGSRVAPTAGAGILGQILFGQDEQPSSAESMSTDDLLKQLQGMK
jgi:hypothetical protein